jgi:MinD-like ATPase involved in chromosome partitioning or flagellar assembly
VSGSGDAGQPLPVLTAVTGRWEARLVSGLEGQRPVVEVVRRCADLADLLATSASGQARAVVLSADLRWLDAESFARLRSDGCAVVVLVEPGDEPAQRRLHQLGVDHVLPADADAAEVATALTEAVSALARARLPRPGQSPPGTAYGDPRHALHVAVTSDDPDAAEHPPADDAVGEEPSAEPAAGTGGPRRRGQVVTVWGPPGAPGRTTTALALATELAGVGRPTLLVDADTYAASIGQLLGLLDEAPGLASAARAADHGTLDVQQLARLAPQVLPGVRVLTGLARAARWPELRPGSLATVLDLARDLAAWTVVDTAACLETDEELSYDTAAPRRNGATLTAIEAADVLLAVGSGDPVGLQRLVRGLQDLAEVTDRRPVVVVTRVRASAVGASPERRIREALERYAGVGDPVLVPDDGPALDAAVLAGRTLGELAPGSRARAAYTALARTLVGEPAPSADRASRRRRPGRRVAS